MGDQPEDAPAVENPLPPVNPPIQPVNSLPLPGKFKGANNPNQADMWPKRLRHFERYRIASGLQNKSNQEQVGTSLYAMGDCTHDIVKTALNGYFAARRKRQNPAESVDTFIQDLYRLAKNCEYGTLKDELIGDWIIVGVLDHTLSDRLQAKSDLTIADATRMSRQAEARKQNRTLARGVETQNEVDYVSQPRSHNKQQTTHMYVQKKKRALQEWLSLFLVWTPEPWPEVLPS